MEKKDVETVYKMLKAVEEFRVSEETEAGEWIKDSLKRWIENEDDEMLVAEEGGKLIGFIFTTVHKPSGKVVIENIFVKKEKRSGGCGGRLLKDCIARLKKKGINYFYTQIKETNRDAIRFFRESGFTEGYKFVWM